MKRYALVLFSIAIAVLVLAGITFTLSNQAHAATPSSSSATSLVITDSVRWPQGALFSSNAVSPTYIVSDSISGTVPFKWIEIAHTGAHLTLVDQDGYYDGDEGHAAVTLPFYFPFYTNVYRTLRVSANGHLYFGGDENAGVVNSIPYSMTPNNLIAAFGSDLYVHPNVSDIYYQHQITPEERVVIEFVDAQWCCGLNDSHTFEIVLYPDGRILMQYDRIRYQSNLHARVIVGIENKDGTEGLAYYDDWFDENDALRDKLAVLFDPGDSLFGDVYLFPDAYVEWADRGDVLAFDADVINLSGMTSTFDVTYTLRVSSATPAALWPVGVPTQTGAITCPGFSSLNITAAIPILADWDDLATLAITVRSTLSSTVSRTMVITYGVAQRDLQVGKRLASMAPAPGGSFLYQLAVTNTTYPGSNRGAAAHGVVITDVLPISATVDDWFWNTPGGGHVGQVELGVSGTQPVLIWQLGALDVSQSAWLYVALDQTPPLPIGAQLVNSAFATMTLNAERGPFGNNQTVVNTTVIAPSLDFHIDKYFPGRNIVGPGQVATFTVHFYNEDNIYIEAVVITDTLPASTTLYATTWPTYTLIGNQVVFTVPRVANGYWNEMYFQVGVSVPLTIPVGALLTNTVEITTGAPLVGFAHQAGDSDSEVVDVVDSNPDLWVEKRLPTYAGGIVQVPEPGGDYRYWIRFGNDGIVNVYSVTVTDTLPISYVTLVEATSNIATADVYTDTPGVVVWKFLQLLDGQNGWGSVLVHIDENVPAGTSLVNCAEITTTSSISDRLPYNNVSVVTATLRGADVTLHKTARPAGAIRPGEWLTYTLSFSNAGDLVAMGVYVRDWLPDGLADVFSTTAGIPLVFDPGPPLRWYVPGGLRPGEGGIITLIARVDEAHTWPAGSVLTNVATISTVTGEQPGNAPNGDAAANPIMAADVYVNKIGATMALPGELLTYTIRYGNRGNLGASGVWLTDTLPISTTYMTDTSGLPVNQIGNQVGWFIGSVPPSTQKAAFTLTLNLDPAVPVGAVVLNTLNVAASDYDGDRTNNQALWRTAVGYDLTPSYKLVNGTNGAWVNPGERVTYTIILSNAGPYNAANVQVRDPLPAFATLVPGSLAATVGNYGYGSGVVTWTGAVSGYAQVQVTFQVTIAMGQILPHGLEIVNTATISDGVNQIVASVPVTLAGPLLDVPATRKTVSNAGPVPGDMVTYTIVVQNDGSLGANAIVTDTLPAGYVDYVPGTAQTSSGVLDDSNTPMLVWRGGVSAEARVVITVPVIVTALGGNSFDNVAWINDGADVFTRSVNVTMRAPDLGGSSKVAIPDQMGQNEPVNFVITVINRGDGLAAAARVTDTLPAGVSYMGGTTATLGSLDDSALPDIVWTGALQPGDRVTITIPATITAVPGSVVVNHANVNDGIGRITLLAATVRVYAADLSSSYKLGPFQAVPSSTLYYMLVVSNAGKSAANFVVTDVLDADTAYVVGSANPTPASYVGGMLVWTGTVQPLYTATLTFQAFLSPTQRLQVANVAWFDDGAGHVYSYTATTLVSRPRLEAAKLVEPSAAQPNQRITYTLVISNVGNTWLNFVLTDTLPNYTYGCQLVSLTPPSFPSLPRCPGDTLTFNGSLGAGERVAVKFSVMVQGGVPLGWTIVNTATLDALNDDAPAFTRSASVIVGHRIFLPIVLRNNS
jgi:uncharacterized repeat protein (TIGR01451 family)